MRRSTTFLTLCSACALSILSAGCATQRTATTGKDLITVAALPDRPGNVTVTPEGAIFTTIHPLGSPSRQLVRVKPDGQTEPFPDASWQRPHNAPVTATTFDTLLGINADSKQQVWVIDMGLNLGKTRLFAFRTDTGVKIFELTFPVEVATKDSFIQDLAVDEHNDFVYLADIANPGILVVNTKDKSVRRLKPHPSFASEDVDMRIDGKLIHFGGKPARVAINPITLSKDKETLFYGAMNGTRWYSLPARLLRENYSDQAIAAAIRTVGNKPISDGAATDAVGNHYFTNLNDKGIDVLRQTGVLEPLIRDARLDWCDNVSIGPDGFVYISVNQLHKTPAFTGGSDEGTPSYFIYKARISE